MGKDRPSQPGTEEAMVDAAILSIMALENMKSLVATMTAMKVQFVEAGWREYTAELMVIEIFRSASRGKSPA